MEDKLVKFNYLFNLILQNLTMSRTVKTTVKPWSITTLIQKQVIRQMTQDCHVSP